MTRYVIRVPQMGEAIKEATVVRWLKRPGDAVKAGDDLVELETEKVEFAISAEADGVLTEQRAQAGDVVCAGDVIAIVLTGVATGERTSERGLERVRQSTPLWQVINATFTTLTVSLIVGNFCYQLTKPLLENAAPDWRQAVERSWFQFCAALLIWFALKLRLGKMP